MLNKVGNQKSACYMCPMISSPWLMLRDKKTPKQVAAELSQAQPTLSGLCCNCEVVTIVIVKGSGKKLNL